MLANEKNLIPNNKRSKSEVRKNSSKGGKKSGEVRRNKKLLKVCMLQLLEMPVNNTKDYNKMGKMGYNPEDIDNRSLLTASLFLKAVKDGDVAAFKEIRNLIGEDVEVKDDSEKAIADKLVNIFGGDKNVD